MISRQVLDLWNRYKPTLAVDAIEYDRELKKLLGTNLASLGTDCCISRQAVFDALRTCYDTETITMDNGDEYINYGDAVGEIEQLPPIQPKRGKWIKTARWGRVYYCNQCRNYLDFDGVNAGRGSTNFCPNCGARMEVNSESN